MAVLSDAVVIGTVLGLVFAAVCYYIYTRVIQSERKMGLMENILLDLKVTMEQSVMQQITSAPLPTEQEESATQHEESSQFREIHLESPRTPRGSSSFSQAQHTPVVMERHGQDLEEQHESISSEESERFVPSIPSPSQNLQTSSSVSVNYEAMTYKELIVEGRKRHVVGYSHMTKAALCDALRRQDNGEPPRNRRGSRQDSAPKQEQTTLQEWTPSSPPLIQKDSSTFENQAPQAAMEVLGDEGIATIESSLVA